MSDELLVSAHAGLLRVTLNRPEKRNPLSRAMLAGLREAFDAHRDAPLSLAVVSGAGDRSFAAGGDLRDLAQVRTLDEARALFDLGNGALHAIRTFPVPVIAALNGLALGGGAELAAACDMRIAAAHARIGFVQGRLNIPTAWGGGSDLHSIVGPARGLDLLCGARVLSAQEARAIGLLQAVASEEEPFAAFVDRFVRPLAEQRPQVMRAFKWQAIASRLCMPRSESVSRDREFFAQAWCHPDHWAAAEGALKKESVK